MAKKDKASFEFSITMFIRLVIFVVLFSFLINLLKKPSQINDPTLYIGETSSTLLGDFYNLIPGETRKKIDDIPHTPLVLGVSKKVEEVKTLTNGFPGNLINELKREIAKLIYQSIINDIDD